MKLPTPSLPVATLLVVGGAAAAALLITTGPWSESVEALAPARPLEMAPLLHAEDLRELLLTIGADTANRYRAFQALDVPFTLANGAVLLGLGRWFFGASDTATRLAWLLAGLLVGFELVENASLHVALGWDLAPDTAPRTLPLAAFATRAKLVVSMLAPVALFAGACLRGARALRRRRNAPRACAA